MLLILFLSSCVFNPDATYYNTDNHSELKSGTYAAYDERKGIKYEIVLGEEKDH